MMKKIIAACCAVAMTFVAANATQAYYNYDSQSSIAKAEMSINNYDTNVVNVGAAIANTGFNFQSGGCLSKQTLYTGAISTVSSTSQSQVNNVAITMPSACSNCSLGKLAISNNKTDVVNVGAAIANAGLNHQTGTTWSKQVSGTGAIYSVGSLSTSLVNYTEVEVK